MFCLLIPYFQGGDRSQDKTATCGSRSMMEIFGPVTVRLRSRSIDDLTTRGNNLWIIFTIELVSRLETIWPQVLLNSTRKVICLQVLVEAKITLISNFNICSCFGMTLAVPSKSSTMSAMKSPKSYQYHLLTNSQMSGNYTVGRWWMSGRDRANYWKQITERCRRIMDPSYS